jgi:hypothetical protein
MTPSPVRVSLSPEESAEFKRLEDRIQSYLAGAQAMADHTRRMKIDEIMAARKAAPSTPPANSVDS